MKFLREMVTKKIGDKLTLRLKAHNIQYITVSGNKLYIDLTFKNEYEALQAVNSIIVDNTPQHPRMDMPAPCPMALEELK